MRYVGTTHRVKETKEGKARPTLVHIVDQSTGKARSFELKSETDELDFILGRFPTSYRELTHGEDAPCIARHIKLKKKKKGDDSPDVLLVPDSYEGLREGDLVVTMMGDSGGRMVYAMHKQAKKVGAKVLWLPPFTFKVERELAKLADTKSDHVLLASLGEQKEQLFYAVTDRDLITIEVREAEAARENAMKARIGCEQRLRQQIIGAIYLTKDGLYPEGLVEDQYDKAKANDQILQALLVEEKKRERELERLVRTHPAWPIFEMTEGVGVLTAARVLAVVGDPRRFPTPAKFAAYCGVHLIDGLFARRRQGTTANWSNKARLAFYLWADQFNRRPNSVWGKKFLYYKSRLKAKHPEVVEVTKKDGKVVKMYTPGHIHRMTRWRTVTRFSKWLWTNWERFERTGAPPNPPTLPPDDVVIADEVVEGEVGVIEGSMLDGSTLVEST